MALRAGLLGLRLEAGVAPDRGWASLSGASASAGELGTVSGPCRGMLQLAAVFGRAASGSVQRSTQNWHGPGESDCLIKTKHCDGWQAVLTQCDFCPVL